MSRSTTIKASRSLFRIRMAEGLQYRISALSGATISIFWAIIEITVYIVFFTYADHRAFSVNGLNLRQVVAYTWISQSIIFMLPMGLDNEILTKIVNGDIGIELCRPMDLYTHWFVKSAAGKLGPFWIRGVTCFLFGFVMPGNYRASLPASLPGFLSFAVSLCSAFLLCTAFAMLMLSVRIGITWGEGPVITLLLVGNILSGGYLPLQLWPDFLQPFLLFQPFAGYLDIPVRLYVGSMAPSEAPFAILIQLIWTAAFIALGRAVMNKKLKTVIVQGG